LVLISACGGGGGGESAKPALQAIDEWARVWSQDVRTGVRPNEFRVPAPPTVELPSVADDLGRNVDTAATDFSSDIEVAYDETKAIFCTWFSWYVETGQPVPSSEEFPGLLLKYGFGRVLTGPPSQRFRDSVELFRNSIEQAQSETEQVANAAAASACALP
jgi:hypothetical protein